MLTVVDEGVVAKSGRDDLGPSDRRNQEDRHHGNRSKRVSARRGAILTWAVNVRSPSGIDLNAVGVILMICGALGVVLSLAFWSSWGAFGDRRTL